jgi:hypothetical protein
VEANGVGTQDEHFLPSPNRWTNREGELGDPTILEELCGGGSTRLGGPFGVSRVQYEKYQLLSFQYEKYQLHMHMENVSFIIA